MEGDTIRKMLKLHWRITKLGFRLRYYAWGKRQQFISKYYEARMEMLAIAKERGIDVQAER